MITRTDFAPDRSGCEAQIKTLLVGNQRTQSRKGTEPNLGAIVEIATRALGLPEAVAPALADSAFFYYRGSALLELYKLNGNQKNLDSAIDDLRGAPAYDGRARAFLNALIEKSFLIKDTAAAEAVVLLEDADRLIKAHPSKNLRKDFEDKIRGNLADSRLRRAIQEKDLAAIKFQCHAILTLQHYAFRFALPLHYAAQLLLESPQDEGTGKLLRKVLSVLDRASRQERLPSEELAQLSSHTASLALALGGEHLELALEQNLRAAAAAPERLESAFACSVLGRLCLDVGKKLIRRGEQPAGLDHFRDAIGWLQKAVNVHTRHGEPNVLFDLAVTHGCLGDAFLRLQGAFGGSSLGQAALRHFEKARELGTPPPETLGLIGDAHFRIGRYLRDAGHLKSAIQFKREAANLYQPSREGWSILGAAALLLYEIEGVSTWLDEAVSACIAAHKTDPSWPWPLMQTAVMASSHAIDGQLAQQIRADLLTIGTPQEPTRRLVDDLRERAVELVIENTEFARQVLGGRTQVFVLSDQHRLLSRALVLKPTLKAQAETEMASTLAFAKYLRELRIEDKFRLPTPLAIKSVGADRAIYAMERAEGRTLAVALDGAQLDRSGRTPAEHFKSALEFLAAYQAWRLGGVAGRRVGGFGREISDSASAVGMPPDASRTFAELASQCVPRLVPLLPKKDAHPENWLVTETELVMLDLESTGSRPLCYEVAQLVDDYGALDLSEEGFGLRMSLVDHYLAALVRFDPTSEVRQEDTESLYVFCWILRCAFGLGFCRRHRDFLFSAAQNRLAAREEHHAMSLDFLSRRFAGSPLGGLAAHVASYC